MIGVDIKRLLEKCNAFCTQTLYDAAGLAVNRTHYEVAPEHFLLKCLESKATDAALLLERYNVDRAVSVNAFARSLDAFRTGNSARPGFSPLLIEMLESAWLISSVDMQQQSLRSGAALLAWLKKPGYYSQSAQAPHFTEINRDEATRNFHSFTDASLENAQTPLESEKGDIAAVSGAEGFIAKFCEDFTAKARAGKIDTVFGRDAEIRSVLTILARRRKNNPILVGEPGVGKTAVIEGLAKRIVEGDVPPQLAGVTLLSLDMGLLEAGAGMKGEFERRLKGVIDEIKGSTKPIVLFIDEAHMLVGAGGQAGGSDAANLLKPALARGELKTCAATTWKEYKKYFEKDPALARRFQLVSLEEPDTRTAGLILRGLRDSYEAAHAVFIRDDAITSAVDFSHRFIMGRFLPDKAIDLLDTACAKVKMSLSVKPDLLEDTERAIAANERELNALTRDQQNNCLEVDENQIATLRVVIDGLQEKAAALAEKWEKERAAAQKLVAVRAEYLAALQSTNNSAAGKEQQDGQPDGSDADPIPDLATLKAALDASRAGYDDVRGEDGLVSIEVTPDVVANVVSDWTGIPAGKVAREEAALVSELDEHMAVRIKGQDQAIALVCKVIKAAKAGLRAPNQPIGVFLLAGPSGVGKTETGLALADLLFGDEESAITINMSEFQEKHTVSRLIGSPPGYVGYGDGGLLTEAVRRRPYSVVLLDEVEKAHPDVLNLFYQVFDKGELADGEGKKVGFGSTVILLTSNLGSDALLAASTQTPLPDAEALQKLLWPEFAAHFKPALLARMTIVPYLGLDEDALTRIANMKLATLGERLVKNNKIALQYSGALLKTIVARCTDADTGARAIDRILAAHVLPQLAQTILDKMSDESALPPYLNLDIDESGEFVMSFSDDAV